jgi:two-component sensor histidine kinase
MIRAGLSDGRSLNTDVRIKRFDGEVRWFAIRAQPLLDHAGKISGFSGVAHDITAQKQNLSRTDSLLREVSHRSKNMLALILAMARLTARDAIDVKSHLKQFALRVAGLAASQDLIVAADWESVDFSTLAAAEIEAVARSESERVKISGPAVLLTPEATQTLGMILTELALNAVEHGALSVASGEVELSWRLTEDRRITISWRETGGPPYDSDRPKGYGISVVERFSTQGLKLDASAAIEPDGFVWSLTGPLGNLGTQPSNIAHETRA